MSTLMVVAHPDDEIIFGYKALTFWDVSMVICATNSQVQHRREEFQKSMEHFGVHNYAIWNTKDEWDRPFSIAEIIGAAEAIKHDIKQHDIKRVITHNEHGEYGHVQHRSVNLVVKQALQYRSDVDLYVFGKGKTLKFDLLLRKMQLLKEIYPSQWRQDTYDWHDMEDPSNTMMSYVTSEDYKKVQHAIL